MGIISNGTTILDNGAFDVPLGGLVLLSEQTASASASISFTSGIDSTYPIYKFEFINIHPATDGQWIGFQGSTNGGSSYGIAITSTAFSAYHKEDGSSSGQQYETSNDLAQSTNYQRLTWEIGNDNDQSNSGEIFLFNPSSTTFVKHFITTGNVYHPLNFSANVFNAGYFNSTSAINAIRFQMESGNIDSGTIKLYGIKDS